ncbi:mobile mystery protein A [Neolewinella agarilytica]|uniref:Mobile mystery protein A n=1 Tax=Neolewinella agarilytica TaxID=478744 RepID=A0A1H9EWW4_9BACT|nr:mobile mystery protein A [Neolewinella agarilytica]SEQ30210.1 mobile mystery protein A [Neolewinella agarilytica]
MNAKNLEVNSLSQKIAPFEELKSSQLPPSGWVAAIRSALNMTMAQLGRKMGISRQAVSQLEAREAAGSISLQNLREAAEALDMHLVYAIVPKDGTLENYVEKRARELANEIISSANQQMSLENQMVNEERAAYMVKEIASELVRKVDRKLWD